MRSSSQFISKMGPFGFSAEKCRLVREAMPIISPRRTRDLAASIAYSLPFWWGMVKYRAESQIMTVLLWPFVYYVIGMPYMTIDGFVTGSYAWSGFLANVFIFERVVIMALPAFILFALVIWSVVNAKVETPY